MINLFFVGIPFVLGEMIAAIVAMFVIKEGSQSWRVMLAFMVIPVGISFVANIIYLNESPRFVMIKGQFEKGYKTLKKIAKISNNPEVIELLE